MQWLRDVVGGALASVMTELLLGLLAIATAYAVVYLRRLSLDLQERSKNELLDAAIRRVETLAAKAVLAAEGTVARELRAKVAAGQVSADALRAVGQQVIEEILHSLDAGARQALSEQVGDVRAYIQREVEAQLERLKSEGYIPRVSELAAPKAPVPASGRSTSVPSPAA